MGGCATTVTDDTVIRLTAQDVARRVDGGGTLLLDTRPPERYREGHLPGARNVRLPDVRVGEKTPALQGYGSLIVYGENPGSADALAMAKRLIRAGHDDVRLLDGGYAAWRRAGLPVERR